MTEEEIKKYFEGLGYYVYFVEGHDEIKIHKDMANALDKALKDIEKYCYSEISYEKIKNLEYISNFDKLLEVHKENEEAYELLRKYPNEFRLKIYNYEASVKKAKIDSILSEKDLFSPFT